MFNHQISTPSWINIYIILSCLLAPGRLSRRQTDRIFSYYLFLFFLFYFIFFSKNMIRHFMQTGENVSNLHEMSNPIF